MSHFTVLVIGPKPDTQLQPFHEFECTGEDDQYVQDIDCTEEAKAEYLKDTVTVIAFGNEYYRLTDDQFWFDVDDLPGVGKYDTWGATEDGRRYRRQDNQQLQVMMLPPGATETVVPVTKVCSFADYCRENYATDGKFGRLEFTNPPGTRRIRLEDDLTNGVRVIRRTNPNKKWDWWVVGGRWRGFFKLKPDAQGIQGTPSWGEEEPPAANEVDICRKGDVDFEAMRTQARTDALARWDRVHAVLDQHPAITPWEQVLEQHPGDLSAAREAYNAQPALAAIRSHQDREIQGFAFWGLEDILVDRDTYARRAENSAGRTFAIVKDGTWYEKGEMGWWGMTSNEISDDDWAEKCRELVDSLPDDTMLTVVDCHI